MTSLPILNINHYIIQFIDLQSSNSKSPREQRRFILIILFQRSEKRGHSYPFIYKKVFDPYLKIEFILGQS